MRPGWQVLPGKVSNCRSFSSGSPNDGQRSIPLDSAITSDLGLFLQDLIRQRKPTTTLEVGLAYGISGLFICEALRECGGKRHSAIDPNQSTQWEGLGFNKLAQAGFRDLLELHESPSPLALPNLEASRTRIEFAFIDGWHTFDRALTDFFHIDRKLAVGGIVVFDDVFFPESIRLAAMCPEPRVFRKGLH